MPDSTLGPDHETMIANNINAWRNNPEKWQHLFKAVDIDGSKKLPPDDARVVQAAKYLAGVPKDLVPIDVAKYLISTLPANLRIEWPKDKPNAPQPANPIIIAFFTATHTEPVDGDQTPWCAAFVCWALQHSKVVPAHPHSAGSRSFREWSIPTTVPRRGDIAVFRNKTNHTRGHVGFFDGFVGSSTSSIYLVGGNQSDQLSRAEWKLDSETLEFVSFRTAPGLRV